MKKNNSPFKMWWNYVGAVAFLFVLGMFNYGETIETIFEQMGVTNTLYSGIFSWVSGLMIGFLITWGITILIRKVIKK